MTDSNGPVDPIVIGQLGRPYGIKGWVWLHPYTRPAENIKRYRDVYLRTARGEVQAARIDKLSVTPKGITAKFASVDDRNASEALVRAEVLVEHDELPLPARGNTIGVTWWVARWSMSPGRCWVPSGS